MMALLYYKSGSSWVNALNLFYPVGAVYLANTSTSPSSLFGGTWQRCTEGGMVGIYGASSITTLGSGGSRFLSVDNLPGHGHRIFGWPNKGTLAGNGVLPIQNSSYGSIGYNGAFLQSLDIPMPNKTNNTVGTAYIPANRSFYLWYRTA